MSRRSDQLKGTEDFRRSTDAGSPESLVSINTRRLGKPVPGTILSAGEDAELRFDNFFASHLKNANTKQAYHSAVTKFLLWIEIQNLQLHEIDRKALTAYLSAHPGSAATIKQHRAAIGQFLDWMAVDPSVSLPKWNARPIQRKISTKNKHETLPVQEAKRLLDSIGTENIVDLRDKTIIALMLSCVGIRVGSIASMLVSDVIISDTGDYFVRYQDRPGHARQQRMQPRIAELISTYLSVTGLTRQNQGPLFQSVRGRTRQFTNRPMHRTDILRMVKRRARDAEITSPICCDSFRYLGLRAKVGATQAPATKAR